MASTIERTREFLVRGIWRIRARRLSWLKASALRVLRVGALAVRNFVDHNCSLEA